MGSFRKPARKAPLARAGVLRPRARPCHSEDFQPRGVADQAEPRPALVPTLPPAATHPHRLKGGGQSRRSGVSMTLPAAGLRRHDPVRCGRHVAQDGGGGPEPAFCQERTHGPAGRWAVLDEERPSSVQTEGADSGREAIVFLCQLPGRVAAGGGEGTRSAATQREYSADGVRPAGNHVDAPAAGATRSCTASPASRAPGSLISSSILAMRPRWRQATGAPSLAPSFKHDTPESAGARCILWRLVMARPARRRPCQSLLRSGPCE